jgi:hypothetical protein
MTSRAKLTAFAETLQVDVRGMQDQAARQLLTRTAEDVQARIVAQGTARGGVAPTAAQVVDGRRGAPLESVRADGRILLEFGYVREIALAVLEALRQARPRDQGDWANGLVILSDGVEVEAAQIPHMARAVKVVATVPYARRLEIGKTRRGDPFVLDDGDYQLVERTAKRMRRIYRAVADVDFTYVDLRDAYQVRNASARRGRGGGQVRYPAASIIGWQVS